MEYDKYNRIFLIYIIYKINILSYTYQVIDMASTRKSGGKKMKQNNMLNNRMHSSPAEGLVSIDLSGHSEEFSFK